MPVRRSMGRSERYIDMDNQIACAANAILWLWNSIILESEKVEPSERQCWHRWPERQAYQNAINAMLNNGLIESFDVCKVQVKINGVWRSDRQTFVFIPTGAPK